MKKQIVAVTTILIFSLNIALAKGVTEQQMINATNTAMTTTTTGVQPPTPPSYASCNSLASATSCRQNLDYQYQRDLANYNAVKKAEEEAARKQAEERARVESARQSALLAQQKNEKAKSKMEIASTLANVASMAAAGKFAATCASSAGAGCQYQYLALSMAMSVMSNKAGTQAKSHAASQYQACTLSNQISTSSQNCGSPTTPFNATNYPNNSPQDPGSVVDNTGRCIASVEVCNQIQSGLPPGVSLKDYKKGLASFASGKKPPFKVNPDGSITAANGKTYTEANFATPEAMAAAGMSAELVKAMTAMNKNLGVGSIDTKKELASSYPTGFSTSEFDEAAKAAAAAAAAGIGNGAIGGAGTGDGSGDGTAERSLASAEGLSKDFNGELIGVAGDDIFKMMNRRYKLKEDQDSFMVVKP